MLQSYLGQFSLENVHFLPKKMSRHLRSPIPLIWRSRRGLDGLTAAGVKAECISVAGTARQQFSKVSELPKTLASALDPDPCSPRRGGRARLCNRPNGARRSAADIPRQDTNMEDEWASFGIQTSTFYRTLGALNTS